MFETATFAGGCFWCTEAIFRRIKGVAKVTSGYTGGKTTNPTYYEVCTGLTGHTEAVHIEFNPEIVSYETLLEIFFATHDPMTVNQQGADVGTQYRSAIFYHDSRQKAAAEKAKSKIIGAVTEILPFSKFYPAEVDHQQYYEINPQAAYCSYVISPKINKLLIEYGDLVKAGYK